jgi:hypothetical protein
MRSSGSGWGAELLIVFISGFLLATVLWLGLWFLLARPVQAAAVREKETALLSCVATKDQSSELKDKVQAENKQLDAKLKEALLGWGRCIRSKNIPQPQESLNQTLPKDAAPRPIFLEERNHTLSNCSNFSRVSSISFPNFGWITNFSTFSKTSW